MKKNDVLAFVLQKKEKIAALNLSTEKKKAEYKAGRLVGVSVISHSSLF